LLIGVVVTVAVLVGGGWAVQQAGAAAAQGQAGQRLWIALGAMAAVGLVVGLVVAGGASPMATFLPSMALLAWTVVYALDPNRALSYVPADPAMHQIVREAGAGATTLLRSRHREAVGEDVAGVTGQPGDSAPHSRDVAAVQAARVDLGGRDDDDAHVRRADDLVVETLPDARREQLGVVEAGDLPAQDDGRDDERPGTGPAARLVDACDGGQAPAGERPLVGVESGIAPDDAWSRAERNCHDKRQRTPQSPHTATGTTSDRADLLHRKPMSRGSQVRLANTAAPASAAIQRAAVLANAAALASAAVPTRAAVPESGRTRERPCRHEAMPADASMPTTNRS
jgi:hypothetical protein